MQIKYIIDLNNFIKKLDPSLQGKILSIIDLLEEFGQNIGMPYSRSLGGGLFELRIVGKNQVRILYCFHKNSAVILHILIKKQNRLSRGDIDIAKHRKNLLD